MVPSFVEIDVLPLGSADGSDYATSYAQPPEATRMCPCDAPSVAVVSPADPVSTGWIRYAEGEQEVRWITGWNTPAYDIVVPNTHRWGVDVPHRR